MSRFWYSWTDSRRRGTHQYPERPTLRRLPVLTHLCDGPLHSMHHRCVINLFLLELYQYLAGICGDSLARCLYCIISFFAATQSAP